VDPARHTAAVNGQEFELTTRQFQLLAHFAANPERIFSRDQLLSRVWGPDFEGGERTVDVHVSWLRTRLRERTGHDFFRTVRGVGYAFTPPAS
jgi:DNA-binding response OmpR family regulator